MNPPRFALALLALLLAAGCSGPDTPAKLFEDATLGSGLGGYAGMTHGAYWGDYDGDGRPDLYVTNHLKDAQLFRNLGQGRFAEVTQTVFAAGDVGGDKHGAQWADFDNDGHQDLVQLTGAVMGVGAEAKKLFLNRDGKLLEVAATLGLANPEGRTRMPLWVDLDRDGRLDLIQGHEARLDERAPPATFLQRDGRFADAAGAVAFISKSIPFCVLTELNQDAHPELVCRAAGKGTTVQVFDTAQLPARTLDLLPTTAFEDVAAGDFDNDGAMDLFLARKNPPGQVAFGRPGGNELVADLWIDAADAGKPAGFSFRGAGPVSFRVVPVHPTDTLTPASIHLGGQGRHPDALVFTLSGETAGIAGTPAPQPGAQAGVYIGLTAPDLWQVQVTAGRDHLAGGKAKYQQVALRITGAEPISEATALDQQGKAEEAPGRLFMNRGGKLEEEGDKRGVNQQAMAAVNAVAGDFDNDMDLDLFVVGSGDVGKQDNQLLLNRGDGKFDLAPAAGGAAGARTGVGDSVTTVDFDGDGFLDLLVVSGGSMGRSLGVPSETGAYRLYRNVKNGNHWLEIDLEGSASNRDGIGAIVRLSAGGVTQTRVQDGGIHHRAQNHARLHFGLGQHPRVDKISVQWPSGAVQELAGVAGDRILRIREADTVAAKSVAKTAAAPGAR